MQALNRGVARVLPLLPQRLVGTVAKRYVAGEDVKAARATVERLWNEGLRATVDVLGEDVTSVAGADKTVDEYCDLLSHLPSWLGGDQAGISLRPSQFGLAFDPEGAEQRIGWTVDRAVEQGVFVRLDMEREATADANLRIYRGLRARHPGRVGCVLQAMLFRTRSDVATMAHKPNHDVRLCKGIYRESGDVAWQEFDGVQGNFLHLARQLLASGVRTRVATHDAWLFERVLEVARELGMDAPEIEFQALLGMPIRKTLHRLRDAGHPVRMYVPFGPSWYAYALGRLRENPAAVGAITKGIFSRER